MIDPPNKKFNGECFYCQRKINLGEASRDHVYPKSKNGSNRHDNIVLACKRCNSVKGDLIDIDEVMTKIKNYWEARNELQAQKAKAKMEHRRSLGYWQEREISVAASRQEETSTTSTGSRNRVGLGAYCVSLGRLRVIARVLGRSLSKKRLTGEKNMNKVNKEKTNNAIYTTNVR